MTEVELRDHLQDTDFTREDFAEQAENLAENL